MTQQKVLRLLFGHPEKSYFASELIELAGAGSGAVQRELARLVESGLVTEWTVGRQRHFQANVSSPIFEELSGIILKTSGIPELLRDALEPLADRARLILLYGSVAHGRDTSASDVDVLIVGDDIGLEEVYSLLESPERRLRRRINPTVYSWEEFSRRIAGRNPFLTKVLAGTTVPILGTYDAAEAAG
ncbi:MAG TPA: nucleotidyltransferase domain-containing protein [Steroidobacteraceae bacterium]|nr:nucleotidyltransferase domain-containing protein [Steroidobacteraceae bacterium]